MKLHSYMYYKKIKNIKNINNRQTELVDIKINLENNNESDKLIENELKK